MIKDKISIKPSYKNLGCYSVAWKSYFKFSLKSMFLSPIQNLEIERA